MEKKDSAEVTERSVKRNGKMQKQTHVAQLQRSITGDKKE